MLMMQLLTVHHYTSSEHDIPTLLESEQAPGKNAGCIARLALGASISTGRGKEQTHHCVGFNTVDEDG